MDFWDLKLCWHSESTVFTSNKYRPIQSNNSSFTSPISSCFRFVSACFNMPRCHIHPGVPASFLEQSALWRGGGRHQHQELQSWPLWEELRRRKHRQVLSLASQFAAWHPQYQTSGWNWPNHGEMIWDDTYPHQKCIAYMQTTRVWFEMRNRFVFPFKTVSVCTGKCQVLRCSLCLQPSSLGKK